MSDSIMPAFRSVRSAESLQNALSISVQLCAVVLVGRVMLGNKLYPSIRSRNSPKCSKLHSLIFSRLILKSPISMLSALPSQSLDKMGSSSCMNWSILLLLLLSLGGLYIFASVIALLWTSPLIETKRLSHIGELFSISISAHFKVKLICKI